MPCPHSTIGDAATCSQCAGITPRRIIQSGPSLLVDGVPVRGVELGQGRWSPLRVGKRRRPKP